jgi:hypothetical protein
MRSRQTSTEAGNALEGRPFAYNDEELVGMHAVYRFCNGNTPAAAAAAEEYRRRFLKRSIPDSRVLRNFYHKCKNGERFSEFRRQQYILWSEIQTAWRPLLDSSVAVHVSVPSELSLASILRSWQGGCWILVVSVQQILLLESLNWGRRLEYWNWLISHPHSLQSTHLFT